MRVVGFHDGQQKKLVSFMEKSESVSLKNCKIRRARQAEELEIVLRSSFWSRIVSEDVYCG